MSAATISKSSLTKSTRRTRADIQVICDAIFTALEATHPMTIRQLFYQLVVRGVIEKTQNEYNNTLVRLAAKMRKAGDLPYEWLADNTRWMRKPRTYTGLDHMLRLTVETYRRAVWANQPVYVEVWLEKDALAGVLYEVTSEWDVPLMVSKGFASLSFLYSAAEAIAAQDKPTFIYYLGDHDPSGVVIPRSIEASLREMAPDADITFERLAVNVAQIEALRLPTRPTKTGGSHSKDFEGDSVEVDAIPPDLLVDMVRQAIVQHVDDAAYRGLCDNEAAEQATLRRLVQNFRPGGAA